MISKKLVETTKTLENAQVLLKIIDGANTKRELHKLMSAHRDKIPIKNYFENRSTRSRRYQKRSKKKQNTNLQNGAHRN